MGCYVNLSDQTKEEWLEKNGERTGNPCEITDTHLPVCLVNNGMFTAAGVAFSLGERSAFLVSTDRRPKIWYRVSREDLRKVSPLAEFEKIHATGT